MGTAIPRTDVGAGGIIGVLVPVVMMVLSNDGIYDFQAVYALIFAVAVALAGYMVKRNKSFVMLIAAPVATLAAAALGKVLYGIEWDNATVSVALSTFSVAFVGYIARPALPDISEIEISLETSESPRNSMRGRSRREPPLPPSAPPPAPPAP
jgi:asparagine N-glycosylation enzyme membrane subunit Stt3